jgi:hypothetical protein
MGSRGCIGSSSCGIWFFFLNAQQWVVKRAAAACCKEERKDNSRVSTFEVLCLFLAIKDSLIWLL